MSHMLNENISLLSARSNKSKTMDHVFCAATVSETKAAEATTQSVSFPLYLYPANDGAHRVKADLFGGDDPFQGMSRIENLAPAFRSWLDARYRHHFSPEEVLGTIYAILHAPTYRERYREFLRIDFPRIPFPEERTDFEALSALGWDLVQKHLLRDVPQLGLGRYRREGKGETHEVEKPRYSKAEERLWINKSQFFAPVPKPVWEFHIGGYQVLAKYLKYRRGRTLSLAEIENIERVANVLAFTIEQMQRIDATYQRAFSESTDEVETAAQ
jgi:predicted helicase